MSCPVRDSIREIDDNSWLIGDILLLSRRSLPVPEAPCPEATWTDATGSYYIVKAQHPLPLSRPLSDTSPLKKVYDAGDATAVWIFGDAVCKVKLIYDPDETREYDTLYALSKRPLSFMIPEIYYYTECDGRYYLFLRKMPGETLMEAWHKANEDIKQGYASQMVDICKELAIWQADRITGIDGRHLSDQYLVFRDSKDFSHETLKKNCEEVGMDCSTFHFYHCDLGPGNIFVDADAQRIVGVIDWETAGFVPKEWIRTKFCVSSGLNFDLEADEATKGEWRARVQGELEDHGYPQLAHERMAWSERNN
ncbi:Protein kinase-like domain protein [Ophiocordyceps sinensis CO18]|uniref:Protein kinase-like domain protein n=1 Tax=Ophiocordyceps sinensis (strain Co18 / CGMCC 3.14243) TaxID=911162 RepID=T4ZYN2_OPHSC|nr:Protein kinase-like domain protein [Ophiocordyceps sinensis CO18]